MGPQPYTTTMISANAAELLEQKIRELEAAGQEGDQKTQRVQKAKAQKMAKTKLKEAKALMNNSEIPDAEKAAQLWARLKVEHEEAGQLIDEALKRRVAITSTQQEKPAIRTELNRALVVRGKLDALFQKLQHENKILADRRRHLTEQERLRRQELAEEFQSTIGDVKKKMDQQANERMRLAGENELLRSRLKQFFEQYDRRDKEVLAQQQAGEAESRVLEMRLNEQDRYCRPEFAREEAAMRENEELLGTEQILKEQLETYSSKLVQFEGHLGKSDKVLSQYKRHKNKMQRRKETLTKENDELRTRNERRIRTATKEHDDALCDKETAQEKSKRLQAEMQQLREELQSS